MDTTSPLYQTLQCLGAIPIFVIVYVAWAWLTSGGNGANVPPKKGDGIIRSDVPGHPEYATQRAAEIVNQRLVGRNRGDDLDVFVSTEQADEHSQRRHIDWMTENGRAASVGVHVRRVDPAERDRLSDMQERGTTWHNPPSEGFDPETGRIDGAIKTERTGGGGCTQALALVMAIIVVIVIGGGGCVSWIVVLSR